MRQTLTLVLSSVLRLDKTLGIKFIEDMLSYKGVLIQRSFENKTKHFLFNIRIQYLLAFAPFY